MKRINIETKILEIFEKDKFIYTAQMLHKKDNLKNYQLITIKKALCNLKKKKYLYVSFMTRVRRKKDKSLIDTYPSGKCYYGLVEK